jgi:hypothetical protein
LECAPADGTNAADENEQDFGTPVWQLDLTGYLASNCSKRRPMSGIGDLNVVSLQCRDTSGLGAKADS